jgi:hypothetical protein
LYKGRTTMTRPEFSFQTLGPVLAVVFAVAAIVLVMTSRTQMPPALSQLSILEGRVRTSSSGFTGVSVKVTTPAGERSVDARGCAQGVAELRPGDPLTAWVDTSGRAWRLMRGTTAICTYLQAVGANEGSRSTRRATALVLAVAGVVCGGASLKGRFRRG